MKKLAMLLVGMLLLAACGGGSNKTTPSATSAGVTAPSAAATMTSAATPATAVTNGTVATPTGGANATPSEAGTTPATPVAATTPSTPATTASRAQATTEPTDAATAVTTEAPTEAATSAPTVASTEVASGTQPTQDQLTSGLLTVSDLPNDWSDVPPDSASDAEPVGFCQPDAASGIDQIRVNAAFQQEDQGLFLQETLIGFASDKATAWMNWVQLTLNCTQVTDDSVSPPVVYQVTSLNIPAMGDQSLAYRLSVSDPSLGEIAYDIVYARVGSCVAAIANFALGVANTDLTQSVAQAAVDHARPVCG